MNFHLDVNELADKIAENQGCRDVLYVAIIFGSIATVIVIWIVGNVISKWIGG